PQNPKTPFRCLINSLIRMISRGGEDRYATTIKVLFTKKNMAPYQDKEVSLLLVRIVGCSLVSRLKIYNFYWCVIKLGSKATLFEITQGCRMLQTF
ncbi:MAG: hypothetical protein ACKO96_00285, partial [Flammeovirgaceae bacterium]